MPDEEFHKLLIAAFTAGALVNYDRLITAERTRDDCRRASEENINRRRELAERVLDCEVMLSAAAERFREYERLHVAKIKTGDDPAIREVNREALEKAKANAEFAARIETVLMTLRPVT